MEGCIIISKDSLSLSQKDSLLDIRLGCVNLLSSMELCVGVGVVICHFPAEVLRGIAHFLSSFLLCSRPLPWGLYGSYWRTASLSGYLNEKKNEDQTQTWLQAGRTTAFDLLLLKCNMIKKEVLELVHLWAWRLFAMQCYCRQTWPIQGGKGGRRYIPAAEGNRYWGLGLQHPFGGHDSIHHSVHLFELFFPMSCVGTAWTIRDWRASCKARLQVQRGKRTHRLKRERVMEH